MGKELADSFEYRSEFRTEHIALEVLTTESGEARLGTATSMGTPCSVPYYTFPQFSHLENRIAESYLGLLDAKI